LIPGAARAIGRLNRRDVPVVVVTNQSGIGKGLFSDDDYLTVQEEVDRQLADGGGRLNAVYHCPHDPTRTTCRCRKPGLALYERATRELGLADLGGAVFVGDSVTDVLPGVQAGGRAFLVRTGPSFPETVPAGVEEVRDLTEAVSRMLDGPLAPE
jgi:D-glycero-D-manno-heptose 1,7-bisphosphate phosphatase